MGILEKFRLDGKVALVTGCRRGIGLAYAEGLAEAGADIIGVSANLEPSGSDAEKAVTALGRSFRAYSCDFRDRKSLYGLIETLRRDHPRIDILVNNAGMVRRNRSEEFTDAEWDQVIEVNLNAQFILSREIGKQMLERGSGKIIFTASLMSYQGGLFIPSYAASKGGIAQLTMALANEWAGRGVNVNAIAPGYFATDLTHGLRTNPDRNEQILGRIPAGAWGDPEDLKGALVFLASDAGRYVHGTILPVDGGWLGR